MGITLLYILLKLIAHFTDATPCKTKRGERESTDGKERHPQQGGGTQGQGTSEVLQQKQRTFDSRGYGEWWTTTSRGTIFLSGEREDLLFPPKSHGQRNHELSTLQTDDERLRERRDTSAPQRYGERSPGAYHDASPVHATSARQTNPSNGQPQNIREHSRENEELAVRRTTTNHCLGVLRLSEAAATPNPGEVKTIDVSTQTDNTTTFIVSKDTLVAYTIAIIQQTLDYQFGQMSIVY